MIFRVIVIKSSFIWTCAICFLAHLAQSIYSKPWFFRFYSKSDFLKLGTVSFLVFTKDLKRKDNGFYNCTNVAKTKLVCPDIGYADRYSNKNTPSSRSAFTNS